MMNRFLMRLMIPAILVVCSARVAGQSTGFPQGSKDYTLLDRLEIKAQTDTVLNFSFIKPFQRKWWVNRLELYRAEGSGITLSTVDRYNLERSLMQHPEWVSGDKKALRSRRSLWNTFFQNPAQMVQVDQPDFFLSVNPVLQLKYGRESGFDDPIMLNSRGLVARGLVARRVGFYTYLTENQERGPEVWRDWVVRNRSVPGAGLYKRFKGTGYDYFDARGGVTFSAAKFIDFQFGYDRQFLGNGYRSLFLSDFSNNYLFANINMRVWRLNYVAKTMQLTSQYTRGALDVLYPKKYMTVHHISFNAPKWLTLGLFEAIVFDRMNTLELAYLNPIIFLRPMELDMGSEDNALVGLDAKANIAKRFQLYGQVNFDEFNLRFLRENKGWWANKWAFQAGGKYIDAFGVNNLDLQLETNWIRPFMFTHNDTLANYTHYNQPLAHPMGANVREFIAIARYQPAPKWQLDAKLIGWQQGSDTAGHNFGNSIFRDSDTRFMDEGYRFGAATPVKGLNANLWVSYEWKENFFLEGNLMYRKLTGSESRLMASFGIRWNMHRKEYDY